MHGRHPFTVVDRYSATARLFHWLTALLVVVAYLVSVGGPGPVKAKPFGWPRRRGQP
jgi:Ni,Fe-hydrogenase I cytochrome b subunit